jgi:hypothetical protein
MADRYRRATEGFPEEMVQALRQFACDYNDQFTMNSKTPKRNDCRLDGVSNLLREYRADEANESTVARYEQAERDRPVLVYLAQEAYERNPT